MVVVDSDGILGMDDLQDGDALKGAIAPAAVRADHLIGKPLREVERYYMEKAWN